MLKPFVDTYNLFISLNYMLVLVKDVFAVKRYYGQGKHLIGDMFTFPEGQSIIIMVENLGGRQKGMVLEQQLKVLYPYLQIPGQRERLQAWCGLLRPQNPPPVTHLFQQGHTSPPNMQMDKPMGSCQSHPNHHRGIC